MSRSLEDDVRDALARVRHPHRDGDVVGLGLVGQIVVKGSNVGLALEVTPEEARGLEPLRQACEAAVRAVPGVTSASVVLTAERRPGPAPVAPPPRPASLAPVGVAAIIAVASGKGGVGKSTTAVNLAVAMAALGQRVGLLDADIYGPSIPRMTGLAGRQPEGDAKTLQPLVAHGLKVMSMGFMVEEDTPMIWRGPMVQTALQQMLNDVAWGPLDVLVVDLPPGTGDAQLTMAQKVPLRGAVIVSTPQDIALLDARKAINMFKKVDVPILGIVENMSFFCCPACGHRTDIFAHGGARATAVQFGLPFLGEIPLDAAIRINADEGTPIVVADPASPHAEAYRTLAVAVLASLAVPSGRTAPRIVHR